ncbi:GntR family transcriptional regulator [Microbacterium esteraromaticum]|nr:GntR family transcriptional regulator [Microbacterium esteraromaticum]
MMASHLQASADEGSPTLDIYRRFRGMIASGQLGADERLPTVRQTARDFGVAQGTAAKAYRMLEQEGLVVTRTAAGTRVAATAATLPHRVVGPIRELVDAAESAGVQLSDVIDVLRVTWQSRVGAADDSGREEEGGRVAEKGASGQRHG